MALVLKTSDVKASVGSNPTLSAHRALVQFGRTLALGARGRRFKSYMPDLYTYSNYEILLCGILARELGNTDGKSGKRRDNRCRERGWG